ncbi:ABC transporter permease [Jannaschia sp. Os4]|uniref:ABC transporter permease n=1 Tax=Jannaschia sp. Os4 TaxID=2807617 RepID=UPI00193A998E|nr:ABC transporter permease [Jannaschia sp. Os4]MBM2575614.1 ABC transporter permease [Jannaschia sp. Os4]
MFEQRTPRSGLEVAGRMATLIFHGAARQTRKSHGNALLALGMAMMQTVILVAAFYFFFTLLDMRRAAIRGDFVLYLLSGVFLFMTHIKAMGAVAGADGPASQMMKHAPMNTLVAIGSAALSALYIQVLSILLILFAVHTMLNPVVIDDPVGAMMMLLLSWFSGVAIGTVFYALKPWAPNVTSLGSSIYSRVNMLASGKMFVVNMMPGWLIASLSWNPLFHTIDQARGYVFVNYNPHHTNWVYPILLALALLLIGLMGEFYTRRRASLSWFASR